MPLSLAYREYGKGPPMVILHGLFGSAQNWHSMAERLAENYRVFACDLRNHGSSPWADSMTFPEMADDLEALIGGKGLAPAIVLGHSVGGKTAMLVALKHPDLIDALVVVDIAPVEYDEPFLDYIRAMREAEPAGARRRADIDVELAAAVPDDAPTRMFLLQNSSRAERPPRMADQSRGDRREHARPARLSRRLGARIRRTRAVRQRRPLRLHRPHVPRPDLRAVPTSRVRRDQGTRATIRTSNGRSSSCSASPASWRVRTREVTRARVPPQVPAGVTAARPTADPPTAASPLAPARSPRTGRPAPPYSRPA